MIACLTELDVPATFDGKPSEMADVPPFAEDHAERPYDANAARNFWRALIHVSRVFGDFRTGYLGKASPVHFFWGSFDLAATRFSGRVAPKHPGGMPGLPDAVTCEAYSHEEASIGFWPGSAAYPQAAFYAYAYPSPDGYAAANIEPAAAAWNVDLGEFLAHETGHDVGEASRWKRHDVADLTFGKRGLRGRGSMCVSAW